MKCERENIPTVVAVAGTSSDVGKTTLMCDLLREFPGWEAIKMTRGHYRSCGKDPHACCVSHLLGDEPLIRSGREQTYECGKDTGRYWESGASNVHWVIVTDNQVELGVRLALDRVKSPGVLIEGNSFLKFVDVDFAVVAAGWGNGKIKSSALWAFQKASALYLFARNDEIAEPSEDIELLNRRYTARGINDYLPVYTSRDIKPLITQISEIHSCRKQSNQAV